MADLKLLEVKHLDNYTSCGEFYFTQRCEAKFYYNHRMYWVHFFNSRTHHDYMVELRNGRNHRVLTPLTRLNDFKAYTMKGKRDYELEVEINNFIVDHLI